MQSFAPPPSFRPVAVVLSLSAKNPLFSTDDGPFFLTVKTADLIEERSR